jgi:hypothetical protein
MAPTLLPFPPLVLALLLFPSPFLLLTHLILVPDAEQLGY